MFYYDGENSLLLGYDGQQKDIILPTSFTTKNGVTVTNYNIIDYAFCRNSVITSVIIPACINNIGTSAFWSCDLLTSVTFENTSGWYVLDDSRTETSSIDFSNAKVNASTLKSISCGSWVRK